MDRRTPRVPLYETPERFVAAIEAAVSARIVSSSEADGGFSPGPASTCLLDDGRRVFVKACSATLSPVATEFHRREATVLASLPSRVPAPSLVATAEADDWFGLITEHVAGTPLIGSLDPTQVRAVFGAVAELAMLDASELVESLDPIGTSPAERASRWAWGAIVDSGLEDQLDPWSARHLEPLIALEQDWTEAASGRALVHRDLRSDNMVLTPDGVVIVDWPAASLGAPWVDLVGLLPSLRHQGGPDPQAAFGAHPAGLGSDPERVNCYLASLAGYFTHRSMLPEPVEVPGLRQFQAQQGSVSRSWLAERLGWA